MNYIETLHWMDTRKIIMGDYSTKNIKKLLENLDYPQYKFEVMHITGTNGKGSTISFLENAFRYNDLNIGKFISPFITNIRESIEINGEYISEEDFSSIATFIKPFVEKIEPNYYVSDFEILFAISMIYFSKNKIDIGLIEVGMGGRVDATNVFKNPLATIFASISMDHSSILGNTISEITKEKSGIMKENTPSFSYPQVNEAKLTLENSAKDLNSNIFSFDKNEVEIKEINDSKTIFSFRNYKDIEISLIGTHQVYNASLALLVLDYFKDKFKLEDAKIYRAFKEARNIGRLEVLGNNPKFIIDGAHNRDAIDNLINSLKNFSYDRLILGFSLLKDKEHSYILEKIEKISDIIILTEIDNDRKTELNQLESEFKNFSKKNIYSIKDKSEAVKKSLELARDKDLILWCGSLYLIKDIRKIAYMLNIG